MQKSKRIALWMGTFVFLCSAGFGLFRVYETYNQYPFAVIEQSPEEAGLFPVTELINHLNGEKYHRVRNEFATQKTYLQFADYFSFTNQSTGGVFAQRLVRLSVQSITPLNKEDHPDYLLEILAEAGAGQEQKSITFTARYDLDHQRYLIDNVALVGKFFIDDNETGGRTSAPFISASTCAPGTNTFQYVRLKYRDKAGVVTDAKTLGATPNDFFQDVPTDYYGTDALIQAPFPGKDLGRETYYPGNVISITDTEEFELGPLFRNVTDGHGVIRVPNIRGEMVEFPTGFFLDNKVHRMVVLSNNSDKIVRYYGPDSDTPLVNPVAVTTLGKFLFVLDQGIEKPVRIMEFVEYGGQVNIGEMVQEDFGLNLSGAADITGFASGNTLTLLVSDASQKQIHKITLNANNAEVQEVQTFREYFDLEGSPQTLPRVTRFEITPTSAGSGSNTLMCITGSNKVLSINLPQDQLGLQQFISYSLPIGTNLVNLGYNLGEKSFYLTDQIQGKVHIFSHTGDYLGSGGQFGASESGNELYYPGFVSTNNFNDQAIEMIIGSQWGEKTGFKRFFPKADLGRIDVIEKAPVNAGGTKEDVLGFRFALTSGYLVDSVVLRLNGQRIEGITSGLFPNYYHKNYLVEELEDKLRLEWNEYSVTLYGQLAGPSNANLKYEITRNREFYFVPSVLTTPFRLGTVEGEDDILHDNAEQAFSVYKNIRIEGSDTAWFSGGTVQFVEGTTLEIAPETHFRVDNEVFEFTCDAHLRVNIQEDVHKRIWNSTFDGTLANFNMVQAWGEYVGGQGSGSAPSTELDFVQCTFKNYLGRAVHIKEGRGTFVNCEFLSDRLERPNRQYTSAAISVDPEARVDIRGGYFRGNDIGVDGNAATVIAGRTAKTYDEVPVESLVFEGNAVGIHNVGGRVEGRIAQFRQNEVGILSLSGTLDLQNNSEVTFENNLRGIAFGETLLMARGANYFLNNDIDVTYLLPEATVDPVVFEVRCNYWLHGTDAITPVLEVIGEESPEQPTVYFDYVPYLEKRGNSYTCTGRVTSGRGMVPDGIITQSLPTFDLHRDLRDMAIREQGSLAPWQQNPALNTVFGNYSETKTSSRVYQEALLKNGLLSYLYGREGHAALADEYATGYALASTNTSSPDIYYAATLDKLAFVATLAGRGVPTLITSDVVQADPIQLRLFPNPGSERMNVQLEVPQTSEYLISIVDISGREVYRKATPTWQKGYQALELDISLLPSGTYQLRILNHQVPIATQKLIKQ